MKPHCLATLLVAAPFTAHADEAPEGATMIEVPEAEGAREGAPAESGRQTRVQRRASNTEANTEADTEADTEANTVADTVADTVAEETEWVTRDWGLALSGGALGLGGLAGSAGGIGPVITAEVERRASETAFFVGSLSGHATTARGDGEGDLDEHRAAGLGVSLGLRGVVAGADPEEMPVEVSLYGALRGDVHGYGSPGQSSTG